MATINISDAWKNEDHYNKVKQERYNHYIDEITGSNPNMLSASDFHHYAYELNNCNVREAQYTPNEVRNIMIDTYKGYEEVNRYSIMGSFLDDPTDDIIDFY